MKSSNATESGITGNSTDRMARLALTCISVTTPPNRLRNMIRIDHIGIATNRISDSVDFYRKALGLEGEEEIEEVAEQKVRVAMLPIGESRIELLEPTTDDSPISKFLAKRGPGIHHVAIQVE